MINQVQNIADNFGIYVNCVYSQYDCKWIVYVNDKNGKRIAFEKYNKLKTALTQGIMIANKYINSKGLDIVKYD